MTLLFFSLQISIILFFQVAKATVTSIKLKKTLITYTVHRAKGKKNANIMLSVIQEQEGHLYF